MKNLAWYIAMLSGMAVYFLLKSRPSVAAVAEAPVEELAHKLQGAWADHHTVV